MQKLFDFDKDNIKKKTIAAVKKYTVLPELDIDNVAQVQRPHYRSAWVHAMEVYDEVAKEVAPKRERLKEMNEILTEANKQLKLKQDELAQVQERVDDLQAQCDKTMEEKNRLVAEMERTRQRLLRAEKLRRARR